MNIKSNKMTEKLRNRFSLLEEDTESSYTPPSLRKNVEDNKLEVKKLECNKSAGNKLELITNNFPSLDLKNENKNNLSKCSVWGNNIKLSVIKDELRVSPVLTTKDLSEDKSMCECYYGDCCKYMNKNIAKYHNKYGVNYYDRLKGIYNYIDTYYSHLAFSSPTKFNQMIEEMEANGETPYFGEELELEEMEIE
jgi:hypothetical protein